MDQRAHHAAINKLDMELDEYMAFDDASRVAWLAEELGVRPSDLSFLQALPPALQCNICETFDSSGTKDGNTLERLEAYARSVARRAQMPFDFPPPKRREDFGPSGINRRVRAFIRDLDMGEAALDLLQSLEEDLQIEIIEQFDIQGTRDGNVRSRFLSFVRGMWCRRLGVNREVTEFLRDLPEDIQVGVLKEFDPRGTKDGNVSARLYSFAYARSWKRAPKGLRDPEELEAFVHHWQLDASARQVLEALPDEVLVEVLQGFDASNTRDGNVTGRFLGYVRRKWAQHYELEDDCIFTMKRLPEEGQILCLTTFDPWTTRDGNISARLRSFLWKIEAQVTDNARWWDSSSRYDKYYGKSGYDRYDDYSYDYDDVQPRADRATRDAILKFVARWDLDLATGAYLESLKDPDVLARVLEEFDPSGTQDGNVLGRLKAFVRLLSSRRKRGELVLEDKRGRGRREKWQKKVVKMEDASNFE